VSGSGFFVARSCYEKTIAKRYSDWLFALILFEMQSFALA
jgi:hypothetical protein